MRVRLTERFVAAVKPTAAIQRISDDRETGLVLRMTPAGSKSYCLRYKTEAGVQRETTIGKAGTWSLDHARERARELRRLVDTGGDPLREEAEKRAAPTVAALAERFIEEALPKRAPSTQLEYRAMIGQWILPTLGKLKLAEVTTAHVERLHRAITTGKTADPSALKGGPRRANAVVATLSVMFVQAEKWKLMTGNPTKGVDRNAEAGRERFLSEEEFARLLDTLEGWRSKRPDSADLIGLAALTGARRGELLAMSWGDVDLTGDAPIWNKPPGSTKSRKRHVVPLSPEAVAILQRRQQEREAAHQKAHDAGRKVVPLRSADQVFAALASTALEYDWRCIRAAAELGNCRFHDLRHSFASALAGGGASLPIIGALLGHSKASTTQKYAHLAEKPLRDAVALAGRIVTGKNAK